MKQHIQSLNLRRDIRRDWNRANRTTRRAMFMDALRFALTTMGYSTQAAETVFCKGRGPLFGREIVRYRNIIQSLETLETINYRSLYKLMRSHGMIAKASFTIAILGCNTKDAICPDDHWLKILEYPTNYLRYYRLLADRTEELRRVIYSRYGVNGSWIRWFMDSKNHKSHIPVLSIILSKALS